MYRTRLGLAAVLLAALTISAQAGWYDDCPLYADPADGTGPWTTGTPESQGMSAAKLLTGVEALARDRDLLAVLVVRNSVLVHESYYHGATKATAAPCHSASKGPVGMAHCLLVKEGKIPSLDTPICQLVPQYFAKYSSTDARRRITVKHLMTMTPGLRWSERDENYGIDAASWVQAVLDRGMETRSSRRGGTSTVEPGDVFKYSTGTSHLASAVVQHVSGQTTEAYVNAKILAPLGAETEHWAKDPEGISTGGFCCYMTAREMMRFGQLFLNGGKNITGQQVVPAWAVTDAMKDHAPGETYGYFCWGLNLGGEKCWVFWGWGGQIVCLIPGKQTVFVMSAATANDTYESEPPWQTFVKSYLIPAMQNDDGDEDDHSPWHRGRRDHHRRRR
jgi:CubicO group peptidase (beta-lactamase class C family)